MKIGATPIHTFTVSADLLSIAKGVEVTYSQNDNVILTKTDSTFTETEIIIELTQEDTFTFDHCQLVEIQLRLIMLDGSVLLSDIFKVMPEKCLSREVLS